MQPSLEKCRQRPEESRAAGHCTIKEQLLSILTPLVQPRHTAWKSGLHALHGECAS